MTGTILCKKMIYRIKTGSPSTCGLYTQSKPLPSGVFPVGFAASLPIGDLKELGSGVDGLTECGDSTIPGHPAPIGLLLPVHYFYPREMEKVGLRPILPRHNIVEYWMESFVTNVSDLLP